MDEYLIPTQFGEAEFVEKKSRFMAVSGLLTPRKKLWRESRR